MGDGDDWYAMRHLPGGRVHVRIQVPGKQFAAVHTIHKRKWRWCTYRKGELVWVPEGERPVCWQPLDPITFVWPGPKPEPLRRVEPRMVTITANFGAVDDAEAAELAREMEADRSLARLGKAPEADEDDGAAWWLNPVAVVREPPRGLERHMVEGRLMRALAFCAAGRLGTPTGSPTSHMAQMIASAFSAEFAHLEANEAPRRVFSQVQDDHADFDVAMGWFVLLDPPEWRRRKHRINPWSLAALAPIQVCLLWRAQAVPKSFAEIRYILKLPVYGDNESRAAQALYDRGIDAVWRVARGRPAYPNRKVVDQIERLRESNRAWRRSQL